MLSLYKFTKFSPSQRRRKLIMMLTLAEKKLAQSPDVLPVNEYSEAEIRSLIRMILEDAALSIEARSKLESFLSSSSESLDKLKVINYARHALLSITGELPAEWDLILPGTENALQERFVFPGLTVFAEDIRSPFNVGSIFRTAEAFGAEKVFLTPLSASPLHQRAVRSAMGCIGYVPWTIASVEDIPQDVPVFALETGGTLITEFVFPKKGMVILGSEELGVSPEALERADAGRVSIPMYGIKASINVGVAFGILMQHWTRYLADS